MAYCYRCGEEIADGSNFCGSCGANQKDRVTSKTRRTDSTSNEAIGRQKSRLALTLLALFLGELGVHRFYTGHIGTGIIMLVLTIIGYSTIVFGIGFVFLGIVGIWNIVDLILAIAGKFKDKNGNSITEW